MSNNAQFHDFSTGMISFLLRKIRSSLKLKSHPHPHTHTHTHTHKIKLWCMPLACSVQRLVLFIKRTGMVIRGTLHILTMSGVDSDTQILVVSMLIRRIVYGDKAAQSGIMMQLVSNCQDLPQRYVPLLKNFCLVIHIMHLKSNITYILASGTKFYEPLKFGFLSVSF